MYLNKTQLNERGWSPMMIERFLGKPDRVETLGKYCEQHLYSLPRIERQETIEDFKTAQEKYRTRRNAGKQATKKQTENRIQNARTMIIRVRRLDAAEVLEQAIEHFNSRRRRSYYDDWNDGYYESPAADQDSDSGFLERITVNYIRHELTTYDSQLFAHRGRIGGDEAAPIIRRRVFEEIACAYPHLETECWRQMLSRQLMTEIEYDNKFKADFEQLELPF